MIDAGLNDEAFVIRELNLQISVCKLIKAINKRIVKHSAYTLPTTELFEYIVSDKINNEAVAAMTLYRRNQPIIIAHLGGAKRVIDGNHRLYRRKKDNCISTEVIEVSPINLRVFSEPFMSMHRRDQNNWESLFE